MASCMAAEAIKGAGIATNGVVALAVRLELPARSGWHELLGHAKGGRLVDRRAPYATMDVILDPASRCEMLPAHARYMPSYAAASVVGRQRRSALRRHGTRSTRAAMCALMHCPTGESTCRPPYFAGSKSCSRCAAAMGARGHSDDDPKCVVCRHCPQLLHMTPQHRMARRGSRK